MSENPLQPILSHISWNGVYKFERNFKLTALAIVIEQLRRTPVAIIGVLRKQLANSRHGFIRRVNRSDTCRFWS